MHTLLATGTRLCFFTRYGATTGAIRPVVLGHTLTDTRQEHSHEVFGLPPGRRTSLKAGEGSEGVGAVPPALASAAAPASGLSIRPDQVPGPITSSMVQGSSVPAVGKLLGDPVTVYPLLPAHNKPRIHGQQVGRAASAGRE